MEQNQKLTYIPSNSLSVPHNSNHNSLASVNNFRPHGSMFGYGAQTAQGFAIILSLTALASFHIMCIVHIYRRRRLRPIDYLLMNMSVSVIGFCCLSTLLQTKLIGRLPIPERVSCGLSNYFKHCCASTLSLSAFAISYQRLKSLDKHRRNRKWVLTTKQLVYLVWIGGLVIILPTAFTSLPVSSEMKEKQLLNVTINIPNQNSVHSNCIRVPLFDSKLTDVVYEFIRFLVLHLAFSICVSVEMYTVRSKLKYICRSMTGRVRWKIRKIRFAFAYSIAFIILWNAFGLSNVLYSIVTWYYYESDGVIKTALRIIRIVGFIYSVVNPITLFYFNRPIDDDKCDFQNCFLFCRCATADDDNQNAPLELIDISRFATGNADNAESEGAIPLGQGVSLKVPQLRIIVTSPDGQDIRLQ